MNEQWTVHVDDNFHYMDEDERTTHGRFDSYEAAVAACKQIVDRCLDLETAKTAAELFESYVLFGDDPWISGAEREPEFSAWEHARRRCGELLP